MRPKYVDKNYIDGEDMKVMNCVSSVLLGSLFATSVFAVTPQTIGWIEHVSIQPEKMLMKAKIDTGADNSSIHAEDIRITEKDNVELVKFTLRNKQGETMQLEKPLVRYALIKRKGAKPLQRPVVEMDLCVGNTVKTVPVNLANRKNFTYRMLIGRSYLKQGYVVDSNRQYIAEPTCGDKSEASRS